MQNKNKKRLKRNLVLNNDFRALFKCLYHLEHIQSDHRSSALTNFSNQNEKKNAIVKSYKHRTFA